MESSNKRKFTKIGIVVFIAATCLVLLIMLYSRFITRPQVIQSESDWRPDRVKQLDDEIKWSRFSRIRVGKEKVNSKNNPTRAKELDRMEREAESKLKSLKQERSALDH